MRWLNRVQHRKCRSSGNTLLKHRMLWPVRRWVPTLLFVLVACGDGDDAVEPGTDGGVGAGDATGVDPSQDVDSTGDSKTRGDTRQAPPLATVVLEDTTVTGSVEEPTSHVIIKGTVTVVGLEGGGDGTVRIEAAQITVEGTLDASGAGHPGGGGGGGGGGGSRQAAHGDSGAGGAGADDDGRHINPFRAQPLLASTYENIYI